MDRRLRDAIGSVGDEMVVGPIAAEIERLCRCQRRRRGRAEGDQPVSSQAAHRPGLCTAARDTVSVSLTRTTMWALFHDPRTGDGCERCADHDHRIRRRGRDVPRGRRGQSRPATFRVGVHAAVLRQEQQEVARRETMWSTVSCWRALAGNVKTSVHSGDPVVVIGRRRVNVWESGEGVKQEREFVDAQVVRHDLCRGTLGVPGKTPAGGGSPSVPMAPRGVRGHARRGGAFDGSREVRRAVDRERDRTRARTWARTWGRGRRPA